MKSNTKDTLPTVEKLDKLSRQELRDHFIQAGLGHIPRNASQGFLKGHLAWAAQAIDAGHDPISLRKALDKKARQAGRPAAPICKPGTRLIREWQGVTHEVTIEDKGFMWKSCLENSCKMTQGQKRSLP